MTARLDRLARFSIRHHRLVVVAWLVIAVAMVAVFASFVLNGEPVVKQVGVGLAFAVAIDATRVRCFLVPALLVLFERWNWWLPGWLDRILPRVDIEGNSFYENRPG